MKVAQLQVLKVESKTKSQRDDCRSWDENFKTTIQLLVNPKKIQKMGIQM
jgi:hypothetical protein